MDDLPEADRAERRARIRGCLLGGAVGDALGAPVEFMTLAEIRERFGPDGIRDFAPAYGRLGAITDDTQMLMFTAEGLIRAEARLSNQGMCHLPTTIYHAYLRWLSTQGEPLPENYGFDVMTGWLVRKPGLHERRAPGNTCLSALRTGRIGLRDNPINGSKGCGTVMRVAPVGLVYEEAFAFGCDSGAITHGHPSGVLAAGCMAEIIRGIRRGLPLSDAVARAIDELAKHDDADECLAALSAATRAAAAAAPTAETVEQLGQGWVAEEALAIAVFCALAHQDDFAAGVRLAVNHSGDSDSTGAVTGNILGTLLGEDAIPADWLDQLELRADISELADDLAGRSSDDWLWNMKYPPN